MRTRDVLVLVGITSSLAAATGCSASIDDIRRAQSNPEFCRQNPAVRELERNAHIELDEMQAHRLQRTELTLLGGPPFLRVPRARAVIRPSFAGGSNYESSRCQLTGPVGADGSRRLLMTMDIPALVPPDGSANDTSGGPYTLQFWSDNNNDGLLSSEIGHLDSSDHLWVRPMCDDGNVYFVHASGIDTPEGLANAEFFRQGRFRFEITQSAISRLEDRLPIEYRALIRTAPMVVEANWQGQTVAYVRTVLRCDGEGAEGYELANVIDPGSAHSLRVHWDIGRDGAYDENCDPTCTKNQEAVQTISGRPGLLAQMDDNLTDWACVLPADFGSEVCNLAADR